jgi:hypothetical protein
LKKQSILLALLSIVFCLTSCGGGGGGGGGDTGGGGAGTNGAAPIPEVSSATSINTNEAMLNGAVIPNDLSTQAWFEYGTDPSLTNHSQTTQQTIGSGISTVSVSFQIIGLTENTKYYFRVCASNAKGKTESSITSFFTSMSGAAPAVTTLAATSVGATTATLNGNVTANGLATDVWFAWGADSGLSTFTTTAPQSIGSGIISQLVNAALTGLATGTTYYFRVGANNASGTTRGSILNFTPGSAPAVTTLAVTSVGATTATLNGNVTANGLATNVWFEWGSDSGLSTFTSTAYQSAGSGTTRQSINAPLEGLSTEKPYYYRVAASNSSGTTKGSILTFYVVSSKTVYWDPPQSFVDNTPLVPSMDLQGYEIYIKQDSSFGPADSPVATASALDNTYNLKNVSPPLLGGVTYYVSLRTVSVDGMISDFGLPFSFSP